MKDLPKVLSTYGGLAPDKMLDVMRKDKVDPQIIGWVSSHFMTGDVTEDAWAAQRKAADEQQKREADQAAKMQEMISGPITKENVTGIINSTDKRITAARKSEARSYQNLLDEEKRHNTEIDTRARTQAEGKDVEAMYKNGINPITKERLTLDNAPDEFMVDQKTGLPVPTSQLAVRKPSMQETNRAQFARSVLHILDSIDAKKKDVFAKGPVIGPLGVLVGKAGLSSGDRQAYQDYVGLAQSAATGAHVGGRFSVEVLNKMSTMLNTTMNQSQFEGAEEALRDVMDAYSKQGGRMSVYEWKGLSQEERNAFMGHAFAGTGTNKPSVPAGLTLIK